MNSRQILANNVKALMAFSADLKSARDLARRCAELNDGTFAHNTINRVINPDTGVSPNLHSIVTIARAFRVKAWMLLNPDFNAEKRAIEDLPPPEVLDMARRIMKIGNRETLETISEIFTTAPISDAELESNGFRAPGSSAVHEKKAEYHTPRQTKIKLKR